MTPFFQTQGIEEVLMFPVSPAIYKGDRKFRLYAPEETVESSQPGSYAMALSV
jgi:hypothetical protein